MRYSDHFIAWLEVMRDEKKNIEDRHDKGILPDKYYKVEIIRIELILSNPTKYCPQQISIFTVE